MYTVFPYRQFGVNKDGLDIAINTFNNRRFKHVHGWSQEATFASLLGLSGYARKIVSENFGKSSEDCLFPAQWGPNYDWIPDQCHGNQNSIAFVNMLMQSDGEKIYLFPSWCKEWNVKFKLYAYGNTTVEGELYNKKLVSLNVTPKSREKDIVVFGEKGE